MGVAECEEGNFLRLQHMQVCQTNSSPTPSLAALFTQEWAEWRECNFHNCLDITVRAVSFTKVAHFISHDTATHTAKSRVASRFKPSTTARLLWCSAPTVLCQSDRQHKASLTAHKLSSRARLFALVGSDVDGADLDAPFRIAADGAVAVVVVASSLSRCCNV